MEPFKMSQFKPERINLLNYGCQLVLRFKRFVKLLIQVENLLTHRRFLVCFERRHPNRCTSLPLNERQFVLGAAEKCSHEIQFIFLKLF